MNKPAAKSSRKTLVSDPRTTPPAASTAPIPPAIHQATMAANIARNNESDEVIARRQTSTEKTMWARYRELVKVEVKQAFNFTKEDHTLVRYEPGTQEMPRGHAEDSFAQAHGVRILSDKK